MSFIYDWFVGKRDTPSEYIAKQVKALQYTERTFRNLAKRARKEMLDYRVQADNVLLTEQKQNGSVANVQAEMVSLYTLAEQQQQRILVYRNIAQNATNQVTQIHAQAGTIDIQLASAKAAMGMVNAGRQLNPEFMKRLIQNYEKSSMLRNETSGMLNDAVEDATGDVLDDPNALNTEDVKKRVAEQINKLRIKEGLERDSELEGLPNVAPRQDVLSRTKVMLGEAPNISSSSVKKKGGGGDDDDNKGGGSNIVLL